VEHVEIRRHLEKVLKSSEFSNAPRAQQFLRFVVEESLANRASDIKEPLLAARVFKLSTDFDRRRNSIVRVEATHVRRRLHDYYLGSGSSDSVIIDLPPGGYLPVIRTVAGGSNLQDAWRRQFAAFRSLFRPRRDTSK
jgi:hypothetical protein